MDREYPKRWLIALVLLVAALGGTAYAGGKLLGANVQVTDDLGTYAAAQNPDVASNGSVIYAVWEDNRETPYDSTLNEIYLAKSTDGGATWSANTDVSQGLDNEIGLDDPAVAMYPDGWVYVVWFNPAPSTGGECAGEACVYMAHSEEGSSFSAWDLWSSNDEYYDIAPQIAIDPNSGDIAVAVSDYVDSGAGKENIYGLVWDYAAETWRAEIANDVNGSATSSVGVLSGSRMAVASSGGVTYLAWEDVRDGGIRIYGDRTTDHGLSWGTDFAISPAGVEASEPRLAFAPDGALYAAYQVDQEIYVRRPRRSPSSR